MPKRSGVWNRKHQNRSIINNRFHKEERLCSRTQIELLFANNTFVTAYPVKLMYYPTPARLLRPVQAMFVVPKRNFRRAHDRNKLKRRMREAYRLNKRLLYEKWPQDKCLSLAFLYTGRQQEDYARIEKAILQLIDGLLKRC